MIIRPVHRSISLRLSSKRWDKNNIGRWHLATRAVRSWTLRPHPPALGSAGFSPNDSVGAASEFDQQWASITRIDNLLDAECLGSKYRITQGSQLGLQLFPQLIRIISRLNLPLISSLHSASMGNEPHSPDGQA